MPSSRQTVAIVGVLAAVSAWSASARAQQPAQGFALERLYLSAPGGGWFVMDDLSMRGELGGATAVTSGYALRPLRVTDGVTHRAVVSDEAFADVALAMTYERFRAYVDFNQPLLLAGQSGIVGGYVFMAPSVDPGSRPDLVSDVRIGFDARLACDAGAPFRVGVSAQLYFPNPTEGGQADYVTDGAYRAMLRLLGAGDVGAFTYAAQLGVHVRPRDDSPVPGAPKGSELLFGAAVGARWPAWQGAAFVVGPEVYGESAFRSFFGQDATAVEGLLTGRVEGTGDDGTQVRVKLGTGGGLDARFGAPEWRVVVGLEVFDHGSDRDKDGVTDSKDACPDVPGVWTKDTATSGCPARGE
jgi:hypothetical protein